MPKGLGKKPLKQEKMVGGKGKAPAMVPAQMPAMQPKMPMGKGSMVNHAKGKKGGKGC